ncbi:E3 ubiquitin-protein ligase TRIM45-like [Antedon mediterranea]|uniref:E3 ubiquitin-protein ligase TRIM45-like n=1 Tax=Antedon mediterranea TaxID=105859 RepID=UPI003AF6943D
MTERKVVQDLDKKVLECPICMKRFSQPRALPCLHTYCLECIENWAVVKCKLQCPLCSRTFQIPEGGVEKLAPNTTINSLLDYIKTMEEEKSPEEEEEDNVLAAEESPMLFCSCRKQPPTHHCKECEENVCIECKKQHKSSRLKSKKHTLLPLSELVQSTSNKEVIKPKLCDIHKNNTLEFFCTSCTKLACSRCKEQFHKSTTEHLVVLASTACMELKAEVQELVHKGKKRIDDTQSYLQTSGANTSGLTTTRDVCKLGVDVWKKGVIEQIELYCENLKKNIDDVDELHKYALHLKMQKSQALLSEISGTIVTLQSKFLRNSLMNDLESNVKEVGAIRNYLYNLEKLDQEEISSDVKFIPSREFTEALCNGVGTINTVEDLYKVSEVDRLTEITEGETFTIGVDCFKGDKACELVATIRDPLGKERIPNISEQNGRYILRGQCNIPGEWLLKITTGKMHIQGSPIVIKVHQEGLNVTIPNILDYMEHTKDTKVMNVCCSKEGLLLVTSAGRDILKFKPTGEFVGKIVLQPGTRVSGLCNISDSLMAYSNMGNKCITTCSHAFNEILSFGKGIVKQPRGLAVRRDVSDLYAADSDAHCIFRFDYQTGKLISTIGSAGKGIGQMLNPQDVSITRGGHLLIVDFGNHRVSMLDTKDKFVKIMIGYGQEDGKVIGPSGIVVCEDDNVIVSSNHKLQLFDQSGKFLKRIDKDEDGLNVPVFMSLISSKTFAVANHREDNIKIYNY